MTNKEITNRMSLMSDDVLKEAYTEILEWEKTGSLKDGIIRITFNELFGEDTQTPIFIIQVVFLREMAKRWFEKN